MAHLATSGHLAHSDADHGDLGNPGDEHGCPTTQHHCGCCASQVVASGHAGEVVVSQPLVPGLSVTRDALVSLQEPTAPHRPPIQS